MPKQCLNGIGRIFVHSTFCLLKKKILLGSQFSWLDLLFRAKIFAAVSHIFILFHILPPSFLTVFPHKQVSTRGTTQIVIYLERKQVKHLGMTTGSMLSESNKNIFVFWSFLKNIVWAKFNSYGFLVYIEVKTIFLYINVKQKIKFTFTKVENIDTRYQIVLLCSRCWREWMNVVAVGLL